MAICGEQYCNPYCKKHICVEMAVVKLAKEMGIKIIKNPLTVECENVE